MYMEQLEDYLYQKQLSNWESQPINKRGVPPVKPVRTKFTDKAEDQGKPPTPEIYPDISDVIPVETVQLE